MQFVFIICQVEDYQHTLKLSCRPLAFTSYEDFFKNKMLPQMLEENVVLAKLCIST